MEPTLLAATSNPGKIREIKAILSSLNIRIITPGDISLNLEVAETGKTYSENARIKARAFQYVTGFPVLADDSGLEVEALDGAPGIFSARYAPKENADDADRRDYLLEQLSKKEQPWKAHFHCSAVLLLPDNHLIEKVGICNGIIIPQERGDFGFGYDPIFYLPEYQATMAELGPDIKNKISHRAKALLAIIPYIKYNLINLDQD
jgi:XTP/dITP diphosphohydrolase